MSGGSWGYLHAKVEVAADRLQAPGQSARRRALGAMLARTVPALQAIEWVDSGDWREEREIEALDLLLTRDEHLLAATAIAREALAQLREALGEDA